MINSFKNVFFYMEDTGENTVFHKLGKEITDEEKESLVKTNTLNYGLIGRFKKTSLVVIVDLIMETVHKKIPSNEKIEILMDWVGTVLLIIADPTFLFSEQRLLKDEKEYFSKLKSFFSTDKYGSVYIDENQFSDVFTEIDVEKFLKKMEQYQLIQKKQNRYYINEDIVIKYIKI